MPGRLLGIAAHHRLERPGVEPERLYYLLIAEAELALELFDVLLPMPQ